MSCNRPVEEAAASPSVKVIAETARPALLK
jgi:hypothetical protein